MRQGEREREREVKDKERSFVHWFTTHMTATAKTGPGQYQEEVPGIPHGCLDPRTSPVFQCLPRYIDRKMDRKWSISRT